MANRLFKQFQGTLEAGVVKLYGSFTLGASGAVASSSCKGFTVTKTASKTGRYTLTLQDKYNGLLAANVVLQGADDAAYGSAGSLCFLRGVAVAAATPLLYVQVATAVASPADAEAPSGTIVYVELTLKNSTAY